MRLLDNTFHEPKIYAYLSNLIERYENKPFSEFIVNQKQIYVLKDAYLYHFDNVLAVVNNNQKLCQILIIEDSHITVINTIRASRWLNKIISKYITCIHNMYVKYKDSGNIKVHNLQDKSIYAIISKIIGE